MVRQISLEIGGENILNVPNLLSGYRILTFPFIMLLIFYGRQELFLGFLGISILTDILDGAIARRFKLQTHFGARLDSLGDIGTYVLVGYGIVKFKWQEMADRELWLSIFLILFLLPYVISYLRFRKFPSLHLYSSKIGLGLCAFFIFYLFFFGFSNWLFTIAMIGGIYSFIEEAIVLVLLKRMRSDCKGVYWVMKETGTYRHRKDA